MKIMKRAFDPLCRCGSVENAQHYFFHCRYYQVPRIELLNSVSQYQTPSLSFLLHGNDSLVQIQLYSKRCINSLWILNVFENIILSKASGWFCLCQYSQCIFDFEIRKKQMFTEARAFSRVTYFLFSGEPAGFFLKLT